MANSLDRALRYSVMLLWALLALLSGFTSGALLYKLLMFETPPVSLYIVLLVVSAAWLFVSIWRFIDIHDRPNWPNKEHAN